MGPSVYAFVEPLQLRNVNFFQTEETIGTSVFWLSLMLIAIYSSAIGKTTSPAITNEFSAVIYSV
jgi:hypothetical protein